MNLVKHKYFFKYNLHNKKTYVYLHLKPKNEKAFVKEFQKANKDAGKKKEIKKIKSQNIFKPNKTRKGKHNVKMFL